MSRDFKLRNYKIYFQNQCISRFWVQNFQKYPELLRSKIFEILGAFDVTYFWNVLKAFECWNFEIPQTFEVRMFRIFRTFDFRSFQNISSFRGQKVHNYYPFELRISKISLDYKFEKLKIFRAFELKKFKESRAFQSNFFSNILIFGLTTRAEIFRTFKFRIFKISRAFEYRISKISETSFKHLEHIFQNIPSFYPNISSFESQNTRFLQILKMRKASEIRTSRMFPVFECRTFQNISSFCRFFEVWYSKIRVFDSEILLQRLKLASSKAQNNSKFWFKNFENISSLWGQNF